VIIDDSKLDSDQFVVFVSIFTYSLSFGDIIYACFYYSWTDMNL